MYLYKQRYRKPSFNLLTDLKKQYRNRAILKPIHFEPLMATPVIRDQHPGPHKQIKKLTFPEDKLVKDAYLNAKRYNPYYSYKSLEHFADIQAEIMARDQVDQEEAYELASFELGRKNRLYSIEQSYTLAEAERHFGMRAKTQSTFFSDTARGTDFALLKERIFEIANMRLNGVREDEVDKHLDALDLSKDVAARLIQRFPELRVYFPPSLIEELLEPEPNLLTEVIELSHSVDPSTEEGAFPLHESDYAGTDVIQSEMELAEAQKLAAEKSERKKREKLSPKAQEQRRIEYQKMRAIKKQRQ